MKYITAKEAHDIYLENKHFSNDDHILDLLDSIRCVSEKGNCYLRYIVLNFDQKTYLEDLGYKIKREMCYKDRYRISWDKPKGEVI